MSAEPEKEARAVKTVKAAEAVKAVKTVKAAINITPELEKKKGFVLSIERFSIHDGPGVRTSIFLKGCPLSCVWCHNPESHRMKPELKYVGESCVGCGACGQVCSNNVHSFSDFHNSKGTEHQIQWAECELCQECIHICPTGALSVSGKVMNVEEVMQQVRKDRAYYRSDGGITLSGGEPLLQPEFSRQLLQRCKEEGITTCVETCGDVNQNAFCRIEKYTDLFLFDFKLSDPENMKEYTGGNLNRILENLKYLCQSGKEVILRCPIIPGINDKEEHFQKIASLVADLPLSDVELMPYHSFGKGKWSQVGKAYLLNDLETVGKDQTRLWKEHLDYLIIQKRSSTGTF